LIAPDCPGRFEKEQRERTMSLPDLGYSMMMTEVGACSQIVFLNCEIKNAMSDPKGWQIVFCIDMDKRYMGSLITKQRYKEIVKIIKAGGNTIIGKIKKEEAFRDQKGRVVIPFYGKIAK
jgi:hypothetical protein